MSGGVRTMLGILAILAGITLGIYAIQGKWPIASLNLANNGSEPAVRPSNGSEAIER